jgi:hypothetical protein
MAVIVLKIPDKYVPKHKNVLDLRLHFNDGHVIDADGCEFTELPDNICTQRCCLKNHNLGIIECNEKCSNRTLF